MSDVDWNRYRSCSVCFAALGRPCLTLTGRRVDGEYRLSVTDVPRDRPHTGRDLRTGVAA